MNWDAFWDFIHLDCKYNYVLVKGSSTVSKELSGSLKMMKDIREENKKFWAHSNCPFDYAFVD